MLSLLIPDVLIEVLRMPLPIPLLKKPNSSFLPPSPEIGFGPQSSFLITTRFLTLLSMSLVSLFKNDVQVVPGSIPDTS